MKSIIAGIVTALLLATFFTAPTFAQTTVACEQIYTVAAGDWLSKLAEKYLGNASAYDAIATQTNLKSETDFSFATIVNPDVLEVGWKLCVPNVETAKAFMWNDVTPGLDKNALYNATYSSELVPNGKVTVQDGKFSMPAAPDTPLLVQLSLTGQVAYGELNGVPSAAVITGSTGGGSGYFYILSLMQVQDGKATEVGTTGTGDRSPVLAVAIQNNQLLVDYLTQGPDQPFCCGTLRVVDTYVLEGNKLNQVSRKELGYLGPNGETPGAPTLAEVVWKWQGTTTATEEITLDDASKYTVEFTVDGKVNVKADCNKGFATYTTDGKSITISPIGLTKIFCGEASKDTVFVTQLQNAAVYFFRDGNLMLDQKADGGTMKFSK